MSDGDGDVQSRMEQGTVGSSPSEGETNRFSSRASLCFIRHRMAILIAYTMAVVCMVFVGATGGHYWGFLAWGIIGAMIFITCIRFARLFHRVMRGYTIAQRRRQRISRGALEARLQFNNPGIELGRLRLLLVDRDFTGEDYQTLLDLDENNEVPSSTGASESEIRRNPSFVIKEPPPGSAEKPKSCAICLYPFKPSDKVRIIPCLHQFHTECIDPWLRINAICPTCKFPAVG